MVNPCKQSLRYCFPICSIASPSTSGMLCLDPVNITFYVLPVGSGLAAMPPNSGSEHSSLSVGVGQAASVGVHTPKVTLCLHSTL